MGADIGELVEKAKIVAEATGRDEADVLEDLLDDGLVNDSNKEKDLVTQLKEAAVLISTVQSINQEVSENTVLNGGENKTEVLVETTLEGDVVDRAIESVQRKVKNIKKLLITLAPLFLLITGGSLEAIGIIDMYGANEVDGGPTMPPCESMWVYDDYSADDGIDKIMVRFSFFDKNNCEMEINGHFILSLYQDDSIYVDELLNVLFMNDIDIEYHFENLEVGDYELRYELHSIECDDGVCEHTDDWTSSHNPTFNFENQECLPETELDAPSLSANGNDLIVDLVFSDLGGCGQDIDIRMDVWNGGQHHTTIDYDEINVYGEYHILANGDTLIRIEGLIELKDIPDGDNWLVKVQYIHIGDSNYESNMVNSNSLKIDEVAEEILGCTNSTALNYDENATVDDDSCEYSPPRCEIILFSIAIQYNNNTSWVQYDLDCGTEPNDQDGYNVSVQFLMSENNTSLNYTIGYHYVKGYVADTQELCLEDITAGKYDFHWIAVWTDDNGENKFLEVNWSDIEITG